MDRRDFAKLLGASFVPFPTNRLIRDEASPGLVAGPKPGDIAQAPIGAIEIEVEGRVLKLYVWE